MKITSRFPRLLALSLALLTTTAAWAQTSTWVSVGTNGRLMYAPTALGDVIPDFSAVGYKVGEEPIPDIPVVHTVENIDTNANGSHRDEIVAAIAAVSALPIQANGYRGAILLRAGTYIIPETIRINTHGIVLRGEGSGTTGTILNYTETDPAYNPANDPNGDSPPDWSRLNCIEFVGAGGISLDSASRRRIEGNRTNGAGGTYVPYGQKFVRLPAGHGFAQGDFVSLQHQPNDAWIALLNMAQYGWTSGGYVFNYERRVTRVDGNDVYLDAPVMDPIDSRYVVADLLKVSANTRLRHCGIENIRITSPYLSDIDENHGWNAVYFDDAEHCWARNVHAYHFGYAAVNLATRDVIFVTVENCRMYDPKSRSTGGRKYSFNNSGQRNLFKDCQSIGTASGRGGRHDFVSGSRTPGPSVFTNCRAVNSISDSGPHHRWTTGHLYDRVEVNSQIRARNRRDSGGGHGWAGTQILLWNCRGGTIVVQDPAGPYINWAIGCTGTINAGSDGESIGVVQSAGTPIATIPSLYEMQQAERLADLNPTPQAQTITFPDLPTGKRVGDADFNPGATASSGLTVSYTSSDPAIASIVSGQIRIVAEGTVTITATQAGSPSFLPATSIVRALTILPRLVYSNRLQYNSAGRLNYTTDSSGNRIPDFSHAGYRGGGIAIPEIATATVTLSPIDGDDTAAIQAALDQVGNLPLQSNGLRGLVLLNAGVYDVSGTLTLNKSGVILSGIGDDDTETVLRRTGTSTAPVIALGTTREDGFSSEIASSRRAITSALVPVGARQFTVENTTGLTVGDRVIVLHPSSSSWLTAVGNGGISSNPWLTGELDVRYARRITALNGNTVTLDAPVFMHLDRSLAQAQLYRYDTTGVTTDIGVEDLLIDIVTAGTTSDTHCLDAITITGAEDVWVRDATIRHFSRSAVRLLSSARATVKNVRALEPHSAAVADRRQSFATQRAQLVLFESCTASGATNALASLGGPIDSGNVALFCTLDGPTGAAQSTGRWATGLLYDGVEVTNRVAAEPFALTNRGSANGAGWNAAHSVVWNSLGAAGTLLLQKPPTAQNYAIGYFGTISAGSGTAAHIEATNTRGLEPSSLYVEQLRLRMLGGTTGEPQFSVPAGNYTSAQTVSLSSIDADATIRYTTDGSMPTSTTGTVYNAPISVSATTTIRAIAVQTGLSASAVSSATYTITPPTPPTPPAPPPASSGGGGGGGGGSTDPRFLLALALVYLLRRRSRARELT